MFGTIIKNVLNMHREPSTDTELVTQGILGQQVEIERKEGSWLYVRTWDQYRAWTMGQYISRDPASSADTVRVGALFTDALSRPDEGGVILTKLVVTSELELIESGEVYASVWLPDDRQAWVKTADLTTESEAPAPTAAEIHDRIVRAAGRFIGIPYLWGGATPFGLDCSGFTQLIYRIHGFALPRDSRLQAADPRAEPINRDDLIAGDLLFFAGGSDTSIVTHVGIFCGGDAFVHSAGKGIGVTHGSLSDAHYTSIFWGARRFLR